jgi:hypothetical protein
LGKVGFVWGYKILKHVLAAALAALVPAATMAQEFSSGDVQDCRNVIVILPERWEATDMLCNQG